MSVLFLRHPKETDLALFAGGELGPLARWRIERHIQTCADCEDAVADFFHLQGDISELAELPPVDWAALSLSVREAVAEARTKPEPAPAGVWQRPLVWRAGLASAAVFCAIVAVRQFTPPAQQIAVAPIAMKQAESAALEETEAFADARREQAAGEQLAQQRTDGDAALANRAFAEPAPPAPSAVVGASRFARRDENAPAASSERDSAASEIAKKDAADERKSLEGAELARSVDTALPGDVGARSTPGRPVAPGAVTEAVGVDTAAEKVEEARTTALAVARRNAPPPAVPPSRQSAANERQSTAESLRGRFGQQPTSGAAASSALRAELKSAPEAEALADRGAGPASNALLNSDRGGAEFRQAIAPASGPGFSAPPGGLRMDTTVAADGGISYRSVDSRTGTITIYDVYAP